MDKYLENMNVFVKLNGQW